jgi:hypothetical protein
MWLRPTPSQERWLTLAQRFPRHCANASVLERSGGWRTANLWSRCALFVLGLVAAVMIETISRRLWPRSQFIAAGVVAVGAAEWLILARRHFASGIEEALEVAGLTMLGYECWSRWGASPYSGAAILGCVLAIAGFRLLNPLFTTLSACALVLSLDAPPLGAGLACYLIGVAALLAGAYLFRRPAHDRMLDYLVIVMPVAGYLWSASNTLAIGIDYRHAAALQWMVPGCCGLFAAMALVIGLRRRTHAPIIAFMLCAACVAYELRRLTGLALEVRLILWGCLLLLAAVVVERYLRVMRHGITSRQIVDGEHKAGVVSVFGSAILTPQSPPPQAGPALQGAGGQFGGAGASGKF